MKTLKDCLKLASICTAIVAGFAIAMAILNHKAKHDSDDPFDEDGFDNDFDDEKYFFDDDEDRPQQSGAIS